MKTEKLAVETDVPLPSPTRRKNRYPFADLKIGESFFAPESEVQNSTVMAAVYGYRKAHPEINLTARTIKEPVNGVRVWRIALEEEPKV